VHLESGVTVGQMVRIFLKYVDQHPAKEHWPAAGILIKAGIDAKIVQIKPGRKEAAVMMALLCEFAIVRQRRL